MPTNINFDTIYHSRWLKAEDLPNGEQIVTVKDVTDEEVGLDKELKLILSFNENPKQLILNKTNAKILADLFGKDPNAWVGKRIKLYTTGVDFAGKTTLAIRIHPSLPQPMAPAAQTPPMPEPPPNY